MRTFFTITAVLVAPGWAGGAGAQQLAQRVRSAGDGEVQFSFASRPDVCGTGENIMWMRPDDRNSSSYFRYRGDWDSRRTKEQFMQECTYGPVRVSMTVENGRVTGARTLVGGPPADGRDLCRVGPSEAVDYLLGSFIESASDKAAQQAIVASVLADSVEAWLQLLRIGRDEARPRSLRRDAVFWVGQAAAEKATEGLRSLMQDGSADLEIRKQAIFALSQRPKDESVPALIDVVRSSREPELRKTALFWLGQSNDARALALFEEILKG
jgi:hypothetical protein